jgi:nucleoside-diphosphate-sugar epimerase
VPKPAVRPGKPANAPTVVITGASGFIGGKLVDYFVDLGWQVIAPVRRPEAMPKRGGVHYKAYDLTSAADDDICKGADYLVHAAYIKADAAHPDAFERNVKGTRALLDSACKHHLKRRVFISSLAARPEASSSYGRQKLAIEREFSTPEDSIVRAGLVIGRGGLTQNMVAFMRSKHLVPLIDGGKQPLQYIAIDDLVQAIATILQRNLHGTFIVANDEPVTYKQFYQTIMRITGIKALLVPVPYVVPQTAIRAVHALHLPVNITEDNLRGLKHMTHIRTKDDLSALRLVPRSLAEALEAFRER